ncbi:MAG: phosphate acyltransferase PlsX [Chloroflexi bacterium]|jgi:phosphate acyltransferase|nr:phosphate acyltransferase PlsX [Chloroflexota bacterium]MBT7080368.1 phosphate acyltransferase PlsX [Chloroflexota bacterium]MBT7289806.1 phosphate acyltransferase PlsX [Chloroflexota bacterium]
MRIALDAMGGDVGPSAIVRGGVDAVQEMGLDVVLIGKRDLVRPEMRKTNPRSLVLPMVDAEEVVGMHEPAAFAARYKKQSSIVVGMNMLKMGQVSAFVSAGNTGAITAAAILILGREKGIDRPALCAVFPFAKGPLMFLDIGANANCKPGSLVQFAQMGNVYMQKVLGIERPRVGLLSIGEEENKGNLLVQEAHKLLKKSNVNFVGNVESKDLTSGAADILVTDGFTGNLILKMGEGMGEMFLRTLRQSAQRKWYTRLAYRMLNPSIQTIIQQLDYTEYGGAFLLGVKGNVIISHGRSDAKAIKNAVSVAQRMVDKNVLKAVSESSQEQSHGGFHFGLHKLKNLRKDDGTSKQGELSEPNGRSN